MSGPSVITPLAPGTALSCEQGGTGLDLNQAAANQYLVTTGNPQAPLALTPVPTPTPAPVPTAPVFRASANAAGIMARTITINKPAGTIAGDMLLAVLEDYNAGTITPPTGWFPITSFTIESNTSFGTWGKVATSVEPANYVFTNSGDATYTSGQISGYKNNPAINAVSALAYAAATPLSVGGLFATAAGTTVILAGQYNAGGALSFVAPTGYTARVDVHPSAKAEVATYDIAAPLGAVASASLAGATFMNAVMINLTGYL